MKTIIKVINIVEASECYQLQIQYKAVRKELKQYLKSLPDFSYQIDSYYRKFNQFRKQLSSLHKSSAKNTKNTPIDYYMLNGQKAIRKIAIQFNKPALAYQQLSHKVNKMIHKINECIKQTRETFNNASQAHQRVIRDYAACCFPETDTFLFKIGLLSSENIGKQPNQSVQDSMLEQCKLYNELLNQLINNIEQIKEKCRMIGEQFYLGQRDLFIKTFNSIKTQVEQYLIVEDQLDQYYHYTHQNSFRSVKSENQEELE